MSAGRTHERAPERPPEEPYGRPPRPPWRAFREALDGVGFRPSRRLGQNFLLDENAARAIARDARVGPGDRVLEVGPGCGFLSVHLAHAGVALVAVELDRRLAEVARAFLAPYPEAEVVVGDVLAGRDALSPEVERRLGSGPWHLVSNLPYSVASPVLALCAGREDPPLSMTVLVQGEVASRLAARPGTRAWGPLSVALQIAYRVSPLRSLGPQLFWPRPRVQSTLVRAERREDLGPALDRARLVRVAAALLRHRRQGLTRVLGTLLGDRAAALALLADLGLEGRRRGETLDLGELAALVERLPPGFEP